MSAELKPVASPALPAGQSFLIGRIADYDQTDEAVYTTVQTPAVDAYSHPGHHKVQSKRRLGNRGEDVRVVVQLGGFRRSFTNKHGEKVFTVDNTLTAVE